MSTALPAGALVVSCQARPDNPLHGAQFMTAMAIAAQRGGARGIRANGQDSIAAIRQVTALPLIGLVKRSELPTHLAITPDSDAVDEAAKAGADIIAIGAAAGPRPAESLETLFSQARSKHGKWIMADIATVEDGINAAALGADYLATTLSGYTGAPTPQEPDLALVRNLVERTTLPVVAEGRYWTPAAVAEAFACGAHAVVVGTAITNPMEITRRFATACPVSPRPQVV